MNRNAPGRLRLWPESGDWQVGLIRNNRDALRCILATGVRYDAAPEYMWGVISGKTRMWLMIAATNPSAVGGDAIRLAIDGVAIGSYPVTHRTRNPGPAGNLIESQLPTDTVKRINGLLATGGNISLRTSEATYKGHLDGTSSIMRYFDQCRRTMAVLTSGSK